MSKATCRTRVVLTDLSGKVALTKDPDWRGSGDSLLEIGQVFRLSKIEAAPGTWVVRAREDRVFPAGVSAVGGPEMQVTFRCEAQVPQEV
jgi:hypothetical protein